MTQTTQVITGAVVTGIVVLGLLLYPRQLSSLIPSYAVNELNSIDTHRQVEATSTLYFTGDVMLARHVESLLIRNGSDYPYRNLSWLTLEPAYVIGNFESALPAIHRKSPNGTFRFSTDATHITALKAAGFTHLSLANNHALDYGHADFDHMKSVLGEHGLASFGHPTELSTTSVAFVTLEDARIAIIGIHTLFSEPLPSHIASLMREVAEQSDLQIVYVHWGSEYEHSPSVSQRELAKLLIEHGVDLIIGHHPHVTQGVEILRGVPVFYSLGNFIFDQYFSAAVQEGMAIRLTKTEPGYTISLIPVTSQDNQAQPRQMTEIERALYLTRLTTWSSPELAAALTEGKLTLPYTLATLTETAIMGE